MKQLSLFAGDSHASPSPLPGSDEARQMTVFSGRKCFALLKSLDRFGLLERMLLGSYRWNSTKRFLIWKAQITKQGRLFFRLSPLTPRTDATDALLLPTPTRSSARGGSGGKKRKSDLRNEFRLIPTPTRADKSGHAYQISHGKKVPTCAGYATAVADCRRSKGGGHAPGQMNPEFVEWLMGYPIGWTELPPSAMRSSRKLSQK